MRIHNGFIGNNDKSTVKLFEPGDSEESFINNLKNANDDWYYKNIEITYKLNENGHRSKSISEIDLNNYIIVTGCSHTFGIGLELEKTYAHVIANKLKCDYYNMAMPGAGIDVLEYNLLTWFGKIKQKPKLVIVQTPDHSRYCNFNTYIDTNFLVESGSWTQDPEEQKMVVNCEESGFFNARKIFVYKNISNIVNVPTLYLTVAGLSNNILGLKMRRKDFARDLSHYGIISNEHCANDIFNHIQQHYPSLLPE